MKFYKQNQLLNYVNHFFIDITFNSDIRKFNSTPYSEFSVNEFGKRIGVKLFVSKN